MKMAVGMREKKIFSNLIVKSKPSSASLYRGAERSVGRTRREIHL
jgi:hypothetical protein